MSYDVGIGDACFNYTYNLSRFFQDHIHGERGGIYELDGKSGKQAVKMLGEALDRIAATRRQLWSEDGGERAFLSAYDAPNGWGSTVGAILFLGALLHACNERPRKKVRVS